MNEHIRKLMGQTLDEDFSHTWTTMTPKDLENFSKKFAELIINKCADIVYNHSEITLGQGYTISKQIKKQFGIE
jgi:hypothetical protein